MVYTFGEFTLDDRLYQLQRSGEVVAVEPQVFKLLAYLIAHRDRVVTRDELFDKLWPEQVIGDAALTYCVAKARKAVCDTGTQQRIIKTVHGHGYRFIAQVSVQAESVEASSSVIHVPLKPPQAHMPPAPQSASVPVSAPRERDVVVWPSLPVLPQRRHLMLVGCLFVCGWAVSLWQMSVQSPWNLKSRQTTAYHSATDVTPTEGKLCPWWVQATRQQTARAALLQGWEYANCSTPATDVEARWQFQRAIDIDPTYAAAYASLGVLAWQDWLSWSPDVRSLEQAAVYLQKAAALDSSCPQVLTLLSKVLLMQRRQAQAVAEAERFRSPLSPSQRHATSRPPVADPWMTISTGE